MKDKRVIVTGADGFCGSHLCEHLLHLGAKVFAFIRGTSVSGMYEVRLKNIPHLRDAVSIIPVDVSCGQDLFLRMRECQPHYIFHLAAVAYVPYSFGHPGEVFRVNALGTQNVLEVCREIGYLKRVIVISSSEIYGTAQTALINEDHPLCPTSPYAASKVAADRLAYAYANTYGIPVTIIRPFNFYGPRHTYDVIPKFIDLALKKESLPVFGDGSQERDFTYVSDIVQGMIAAALANLENGMAINLGSGKSWSIVNIARTILRICESQDALVYYPTRVAEVEKLICDNSRAKSLLGWKAEVSLEEGITLNVGYARMVAAARGSHESRPKTVG